MAWNEKFLKTGKPRKSIDRFDIEAEREGGAKQKMSEAKPTIQGKKMMGSKIRYTKIKLVNNYSTTRLFEEQKGFKHEHKK